MEFLKGVNFSLLVSCADYHKYHNELYLHAHNGLCHLCCCIRWEIWSRPQSSSVFVLFRAQQDFDLFLGEKCDEFASEYRRCLQNFVVGELCILCGTREWMDWWLEDWVDLFKWMEGAWRVSGEWVESEWRVNGFVKILIEILKEASIHLGTMKLDHLGGNPLASLNPFSWTDHQVNIFPCELDSPLHRIINSLEHPTIPLPKTYPIVRSTRRNSSFVCYNQHFTWSHHHHNHLPYHLPKNGPRSET